MSKESTIYLLLSVIPNGKSIVGQIRFDIYSKRHKHSECVCFYVLLLVAPKKGDF